MAHKIGRNAPCPCGSGKKYKKCCLPRDEAQATTSLDTLSRSVNEGYRLMADGNEARACECWWKVWETARTRMRPDMRTCQSTGISFQGTEPLFNWVQDFAEALYNAVVDDAAAYADMGIRLFQQVLAQFPDESELFVLNFRAQLGEFYFLAGQPSEGERVLLGLIHDHPDTALGYVRLSDILARGGRRDDPPIDPKRAVQLLEQALARPVRDAPDYDVEARLHHLRNPEAPPQ